MSWKSKEKKPRNWHAVNAHFRRAGAMGNSKKAESAKECRKFKSSKNQIIFDEDEDYQGDGYNGSTQSK